MTRARRLASVLILSTIAAGACARAPHHEEMNAPNAAGTDPVTLRVMSFNIEWGGAHVRFASVVEAIRASGAEIVGIQEAEGNLQRLAADLGWHYNLRNYVVSKHRIIDPPGADGKYVYVEIRPGAVVAMANVHLPSDPYGPDLIRDHESPRAVLDLERRVRLPKIEPYLDVLPGLFENGIPVFLTGDFNAPSHADWTEAVVGTRPFVTYSFDWPVSRAVVDAGLRDSFRDAYPDPVTHPGMTWWAQRGRIRDYNPGPGDPRDRIDFLWYAGPATVTESEIVGEADAAGVSIITMPWPSDHRGVVSTFDVVPAPLPTLVAAEKRVYRSDENVRVVYNAPGRGGGSIALARTSDAGGPALEEIETFVDERGELEWPAESLAAGRYELLLSDASGDSIGRNDFWILDPDAVPSVEVVGSSFASGEPVPIRWQDGPGNRNDWLAVFDARAPHDDQGMLAWGYVEARCSGTLDLAESTAEAGWPLPPGRYVVRLLKDDGSQVLAESSPFSVE